MSDEKVYISNARFSGKIGNIGEQFVKLYYLIKGYEVGDGQPGGFFDVWYASKKTGIVRGVQVKTSRMRLDITKSKHPYYCFVLSGDRGSGRTLKISPCDYVLVAISDNGNVRFMFNSYEEIKELKVGHFRLSASEMHQNEVDFTLNEKFISGLNKEDHYENFIEEETDLTPSQGLLFCMEKQ
jgi:hypothetical protein